MNSLTKQEFLDTYGHLMVKFGSYRKFSFTFVGTLASGDIVIVEACECSNEVYDFEVSDGEHLQISEIDFLHKGEIYRGQVLIESFYD